MSVLEKVYNKTSFLRDRRPNQMHGMRKKEIDNFPCLFEADALKLSGAFTFQAEKFRVASRQESYVRQVYLSCKNPWRKLKLKAALSRAQTITDIVLDSQLMHISQELRNS